MKTQQLHWTKSKGWDCARSAHPPSAPSLVLLFGGRETLAQSNALSSLAEIFPRETFMGCSTAGEIADTHIHDDSVVATAVWLERSRVHCGVVRLADVKPGESLGGKLAATLPHLGLVHVVVLSDGVRVNGSELVNGLVEALPKDVGLTGGLSGDGEAMQQTSVCYRGTVESGTVAVVGFYGELKVSSGSMGGWDAFGPERFVTRSQGNVLYELDGTPALALYKRYLGRHVDGLPSSALLFPLFVAMPGEEPVVRTIVGMDEASGALFFAGNVPTGAQVRLMRANFDRIIGGAFDAADASKGQHAAELALLISCVGRRQVLKQRTEEETEAVREVLGPNPVLTGFYSYGELAPVTRGARCQLHNQTMTVTTFSEG